MCYYELTLIFFQCSELARSTFSSHWYGHSVRVQKMALLMIARAQRVLTIKIPFFSPSLETLTSVSLTILKFSFLNLDGIVFLFRFYALQVL